MFGINDFSQLGDIIEGHYKEITNQETELYNRRIAICRKCPLYTIKEGLGEVCDAKKCWNEKEKAIETVPSANNICGCNCRLAAKTRLKNGICVLNKWT